MMRRRFRARFPSVKRSYHKKLAKPTLKEKLHFVFSNPIIIKILSIFDWIIERFRFLAISLNKVYIKPYGDSISKLVICVCTTFVVLKLISFCLSQVVYLKL